MSTPPDSNQANNPSDNDSISKTDYPTKKESTSNSLKSNVPSSNIQTDIKKCISQIENNDSTINNFSESNNKDSLKKDSHINDSQDTLNNISYIINQERTIPSLNPEKMKSKEDLIAYNRYIKIELTKNQKKSIEQFPINITKKPYYTDALSQCNNTKKESSIKSINAPNFNHCSYDKKIEKMRSMNDDINSRRYHTEQNQSVDFCCCLKMSKK